MNSESVAALAEACRRRGVPLIHLSTDYVFDGRKSAPYVEDDPPAPLNAYGRSKLSGEAAVREHLCEHIILRTSWVYSSHGNNFLKTILRLGATRDQLCIVNDQYGAPTAAGDIAEVCISIAEQIADESDGSLWGTYHFAAAGETTWLGFAEEIFRRRATEGRRVPHLLPIPTSEYPTAAKRPLNSRLDCTKIERAFGLRRREWTSALTDVMREIDEYERAGA